MRYNGVDIKTAGRGISIAKTKMPQRSRDIEMVETNTGMLVGYAGEEAESYTASVNIHGRTPQEAAETWLRLCAWAKGGGGVHALEVDELPLKAYDAIFEAATELESSNGSSGVCQMTWQVVNPHPYSVIGRAVRGSAGKVNAVIGGTAETDAVYEVTASSGRTGLTIKVDGETVVRLDKGMSAGSRVVVNTAKEKITLDGADVTRYIDWTQTDWGHGLKPGKREIDAGSGAEIVVRWHDRWG